MVAGDSPCAASASGLHGDAAGGAGLHEWTRLMPWWHAAFALTVIFTSAWAVLDDHHRHPARLAVALGLYAVLALWYVVAPGGPRRGGASVAYLAGALLIFAVAVFVYSGTGFLCFILIPQCFLYLDVRPALVAVVGVTLVLTAAELSNTPLTKGNTLTIALFGFLTLGFSVLIGTYISRIAEQSRQRAELIDELDRTRAELARMSRDAGVQAERERLAGEIHDTLAQGFTSILMLMQAAQSDIERSQSGPGVRPRSETAAEPRSQRAALAAGDALRRHIELAESTAREGLAEARSLVTALGPVALQSAPLAAALGRVVSDFSARSGVRGHLSVEGASRALPANTEVVLLRAAQEALTNVYRHAGASEATVTLTYEPAGACLVVADNGCGFDTSATVGHDTEGSKGEGSRNEGYGLRGMRARVEQVGGHIAVRAAGRGEHRHRRDLVTRVIIVDDHPVVREGLRGMLVAEPGIDVVGEASTGEEAVALAAEVLPDVVLMDLRMPGMDGAEATERIRRANPAIYVLVITTYDTDRDILRAVEAGATGYLLKDTPRAELARAVRAAATGETVLAPPVAARLMTRALAPSHEELTSREVEVLAQVALGRTNDDIGRTLFIAAATVKSHLLHIFAKLGVDDRTAAVTVAMARGILAAPDDRRRTR